MMRVKRTAEEPNEGRATERGRTVVGGADRLSCVEVDRHVGPLGVNPAGRHEMGKAMPAFLRDLVRKENSSTKRGRSERRQRRWG